MLPQGSGLEERFRPQAGDHKALRDVLSRFGILTFQKIVDVEYPCAGVSTSDSRGGSRSVEKFAVRIRQQDRETLRKPLLDFKCKGVVKRNPWVEVATAHGRILRVGKK